VPVETFLSIKCSMKMHLLLIATARGFSRIYFNSKYYLLRLFARFLPVHERQMIIEKIGLARRFFNGKKTNYHYFARKIPSTPSILGNPVPATSTARASTYLPAISRPCLCWVTQRPRRPASFSNKLPFALPSKSPSLLSAWSSGSPSLGSPSESA
jgi:hypothetical protein